MNSTFYRLASRPAVQRWVDNTPPGFLFSVKASRYLTHVRRLRDNDWKGFAVRNAIDLRKRLEAVCHPVAGEEET